MTLEVARATKLNKRLRLIGVDLHHLRADHLSAVGEPNLGYHLTLETIDFAETDDGVVAVLPLKVQIHHKADDRTTPLAELEVALRLAYQLHEAPLEPEERDVLPDFLGIVGWMQAWPYSRAEIQALSTKLGFPALLLPILHAGGTAQVQVRRAEVEQDSEQPQSKS